MVSFHTVSFINNINLEIPEASKKAKRVTEKDFYIPDYSEYKLVIANNYRMPQLKKMCKFYKLPVTGNKTKLTNNLYRFLYLSKFALVIQKSLRGSLCRSWCVSHGPAYINREICTNRTDFFSMQELTEIPINQFFSYKDEDDFVYGFDVMSLYTLHKKAVEEKKTAINPYNRNKLPLELLGNLRTMIRISRVLKYDIKITIDEDEIAPSKNLELRILSLFQTMDSLGNYTDTNWFNGLSRDQITIFLRELYDIWSYRAQLSEEIKREIVSPTGDPFRSTNIQHLSQLPFDTLKKLAVSIMEMLVNKGINDSSRSLGANYVLCALTLVNIDVANALPWLYQSVAHTG